MISFSWTRKRITRQYIKRSIFFLKKKENTRHNGWRPLSRNKRKKKGFSWLFLHYALSIYLQHMFFSTTMFGLNAFRYWFELFSAIWCSSFHERTKGLYVNILEAEFFKNMHDATTGCHCQEKREKKRLFSRDIAQKNKFDALMFYQYIRQSSCFLFKFFFQTQTRVSTAIQ